jgi:pyruvate/2-oxoglutarate dehydrogenase complex dihydrolipoamide acyltransferase (E2) component
MRRPLVVTDCDEVLLHMVRHFRDWLGGEHGIEFLLEGNPFVQSVRRRDSDQPVEEAELWRLLNLFFETEMARQTAIEGAAAAIAELQREADVVVLTNLVDRFGESRRQQLRDHGIDVRVVTNQGPKGEAVRRIVEAHAPARAVFIDDLAQHHASAAAVLPDIARLHFCGEPAIAPHVPCAQKAGHAHARIDTWDEALPWLLETLHGSRP